MSARATWSRAPWSIQLYAMLIIAVWLAGLIISPETFGEANPPVIFRLYASGTGLLIFVLLLHGLFTRNRFVWRVAIAWGVWGLLGPVLSILFAGGSFSFFLTGLQLVYYIAALIQVAVLLAPATRRWIERPMPPPGGEAVARP